MFLFYLISRERRLSGQKQEERKMVKGMNLQDVFLNQARREKISITIYLVNGFQFKGTVKGFESYTVILDSDGKQNLVYKHAISTITPSRHISILDSADRDDAEE